MALVMSNAVCRTGRKVTFDPAKRTVLVEGQPWTGYGDCVGRASARAKRSVPCDAGHGVTPSTAKA